MSEPYDQALALGHQGRWDQALPLFAAAFEQNPASAQAANCVGIALCNLGRMEEALPLYAQALALDPQLASAAANWGAALQGLGRWDEAIAVLKQAVATAPNHANSHYNLGHAYHHCGRFEEAVESYTRAGVLAPDYRQAWTNLSVSLRELNRLEPALEALDQALAIDPGNAMSHFNKAFMLLEQGDLHNGWVEHEWRFQAGITKPRPYVQAQWQGQPMPGETLLVWAEQGFGDTLQFVRFLPLVAERGIHVVLEVQPHLKSLLDQTPGTVRVIAEGEPLPAFQRHIPLMSLALALGLDRWDLIPNTVPYIPLPEPFDLPRFNRPRIGLVWAGSSTHKNDRRRSVPLECAARIAAVPGIDWVSLQVGSVPHPPNLAPPPVAIGDFRDTARLLLTLDLVISVDTSVAHLAGAMGVPVWTLHPFAPDWRWLLGRTDSPWYPQMRLYRQIAPGDWDSVVAAVERDLPQITPRAPRSIGARPTPP